MVELLIAIAIIAVIAGLVTTYVYKRRAQTKLARVTAELTMLASALAQYAEDNNYTYPGDAGRGIPPGLEKYMAAGSWPVSIWPNGVFDYDQWTHPGPGADQGKPIYQVSYRLCDLGDPIESCSDPDLFPNFTRYSAILYCISGPCVPHVDHITDPGYCVNCTRKEMNY